MSRAAFYHLRVHSGLSELTEEHQFPTRNNVLLVPANIITQALEALEHVRNAALASPTPRQSQSPILSAIAQRQLWDRLRSICPKGAFHSGPIFNAAGEQCTTAQEYDQAMLDTRSFWFKRQVQYDNGWANTLQEYCACKSPWPWIPPPTLKDYESHILNTKDSATGPDGMPYAVWRTFSSITAQLLQRDFFWLVSDMAPPPTQIGVWIPKAQLGNTADYFRPLGMADTLDRLQDGALAAQLFTSTREWFHPAQTLLNHFREPQAAVQNVQEALDSSDPRIGIFLDLSKAFERINPNWVIAILFAMKAPIWVINSMRRLLFGRLIRHKVQGFLLPARQIWSGVDMGRSTSVFLFCLAMDPIFTSLNSIPRVQLVSGYIDDTTIVGQGLFPAQQGDWITEVTHRLSRWESAGIVMDKHSCWSIRSITQLTFPIYKIVRAQQVCDCLGPQTFGHASFREAVLKNPIAGPVFVSREALGFVCHSRELVDYLTQGSALLLELAAPTCNCRAKTVVLPNYVISEEDASVLDKSGLGAHCVQRRTVSLGLHVSAAGRLLTRPRPQHTPANEPFGERFKKQLHKLEQRLQAMPKAARSIRTRILYFNTYCLSLLFYSQSVHFTPYKEMTQLYNMMS